MRNRRAFGCSGCIMQALVVALLLLLECCAALTADGLSVQYFAYGSWATRDPNMRSSRSLPISNSHSTCCRNMKSSVLQRRVGAASPLNARPGVVRDYTLEFTLPGFGLEPAFASCAPALGEVCHGVVYTLSVPQWLRVCATEGVPAAYRIETVPVECYDGSRMDVYTLRAVLPLPVSLPPSQRYLSLLQEGAKEVRWPAHVLHRATGLLTSRLLAAGGPERRLAAQAGGNRAFLARKESGG